MNLFLLVFVSLSAVCVVQPPRLLPTWTLNQVRYESFEFTQGARFKALLLVNATVSCPGLLPVYVFPAEHDIYFPDGRGVARRLGRASTPGVLLARGENAVSMRFQTDRVGAAAALALERGKRRSKGVQVLREAGIAWFVVAGALPLPLRARVCCDHYIRTGVDPLRPSVVPATFEGAKCSLSLLLPFGDGGGNDACTGNRSEEEVERDSGGGGGGGSDGGGGNGDKGIGGLLGSLFGDGGLLDHGWDFDWDPGWTLGTVFHAFGSVGASDAFADGVSRPPADEHADEIGRVARGTARRRPYHTH